ncbi:MAG: hypothetical protein GAK35_03359 [Herbaspirillum frisingense]|uniref:Uncharacterized protein n=1 Tax=Herbaspirillum frisingense TaxID=92645 RepID=A0A7V8JTA8_9BURK|nr:MAG: hypothetical protein GAK35_03359 [Herbaspirillum frisingense]
MQLALASGAAVIALVIEHDEDADTQMPVLSRTLFLLVVDMWICWW